MLSQSQQQAAGGFAAHPRVVPHKAKYKDPYGQANTDEYYPQNIMHDKRVFRGSTNAAMVIPAGTYPDQLFQANKRKYDPKQLEQQRAKAAEEFFTRDVKTPEAAPGKQNIDIQTDQFVSELTDKAPVYEIGCQTEYKVDRPPTPHRMPKLMGVSKKTLVEDNELFLFEDEVEPILQVLCGKTLEIARMEVLQEEELAEMHRQQVNFHNLTMNEKSEIEKMEEQEKKRLDQYNTKKNLEKNRKAARKIAHEKVVCRQIAKSYTRDLRSNAYVLLKDIGFFQDEFKEVTMRQDVLPWLMGKTENFVKQIENFERYPNTLIARHIDNASTQHVEKVNEHIQKLENIKQAEHEAYEAKIAAKLKRQREREAKRKREEIERLNTQIEAQFVQKIVPVENILMNDLVDIDGQAKAGKQHLTVLGGYLGQLMIICNAVAKQFGHMDRKSKGTARQSTDSRPKTPASEKSASKSQKSGDQKSERMILNAANIQTFIYNYVLEKLKVEKLAMQVDHRFESFLASMPKPLQLNEMRTMKEPNYTAFRDTNSRHMGNPVLQLIKENQERLGLDPEVFDLVFEGFFDLYTFKPKCPEVSAKKLQQWIQKIVLTTTPKPAPTEDAEEKEPEEKEEGEEDNEEEKKDAEALKNLVNEEPLDEISPINAVVRIRIPKMVPEPEMDDEGNPIEVEYNEDELEEVPFEDKAASIATVTDTQQIYAINQLVSRTLRQDIALEFRASIERLENIDNNEFLQAVEDEAELFEAEFLKLFEDSPQNDSRAPKVPVFDYKPVF